VNWQKKITRRDMGGNLVLGEGNPLYSGQICGSLELMMMMIIIIITTELIIGENCYIASTQCKLTDTQEMRFSIPRNARYMTELNLGMKRRRRRRNGRKGR